jgi:hypothetical protein
MKFGTVLRGRFREAVRGKKRGGKGDYTLIYTIIHFI